MGEPLWDGPEGQECKAVMMEGGGGGRTGMLRWNAEALRREGQEREEGGGEEERARLCAGRSMGFAVTHGPTVCESDACEISDGEDKRNTDKRKSTSVRTLIDAQLTLDDMEMRMGERGIRGGLRERAGMHEGGGVNRYQGGGEEKTMWRWGIVRRPLNLFASRKI
ncbi:hypothetical protein PLICRDRAFT_33191 [Plicaturopsis crispa FD-325 SS-3]|uniref:Uncharacterized protein n=1 Tax=Plicaturopsis crispa FD-325 SS-3 TaxID=944288 RepID=A0A0C9SV78_PLICR|nr:hypothetical protein PLICRDRAFT_33191 [Plicaturopsis crispa FD-325 SS-3]